MQSFYDKAKKVIAQNQDMFTVFEELDRTGRFRKRTYKKRADFTIDEDILIKFKNYCKKNNIKMSAKIESLIREELKCQN